MTSVRVLFGTCLPLLACQGSYELRAYGEAFVEEGIPAEEVSDGWEIRFSEFVLSIGEVSVEGPERRDFPGWYVFDLARPSQGQGHLLDSVAAPYGDYDILRYCALRRRCGDQGRCPHHSRLDVPDLPRAQVQDVGPHRRE